MSKVNADNSAISVHGREVLRVPYSRWIKDSSGQDVEVDISQSNLYFEVAVSNLRRKLIPDPNNPKGLLIYLTRPDVQLIPTQPAPFIVIDETTFPAVEWEGRIYRSGYTEQPNG